MGILSKDMIEKWILPYLPLGKRGFKTTVPIIEIVECILYRLKTGCHGVARRWRQLPVKQFFSDEELKWGSVASAIRFLLF